jgi:hypothetical protein
MIDWIDIASIVFASVTANHLDLIKAFEEILGRELPVINCVKCCSFWAVLIYTLFATHDVIMSLAVSFLASYSAIWLELIEGIIDNLYKKIYDTIYPTDD